MVNSSSKTVKEIAENLDSGNDCYYNFKTNEIIAIPNESQIFDDALFEEVFAAELARVSKKSAGFMKIEGLKSFESFEIMENFTQQLTDTYLQNKLESALVRKKTISKFQVFN
jgi:hypothetical protein